MDSFIKVLVLVFLLLMIVLVDGEGDKVNSNRKKERKVDRRRTERRLRLVEDALAEERLSRKDDVDRIMTKLSHIETLVKSSAIQPSNQDLTDLEQGGDMRALMRSVKRAFSTEKELNMRLRRELVDKHGDQNLLKKLIEETLQKLLEKIGLLDKTLATKSDHELLINMLEDMLKKISEKLSTLHRSIAPLPNKLRQSETCMSQYTENAAKKSDLAELNEKCVKSLAPLDEIQENTKNLVTTFDFSSLKEFIQEMKYEFKPHIIKQRSCKDLYERGFKKNGVYEIYLNTRPIQVYCDQETDGGGWTVFQRRQDGSVDFYRNWDDYKKGFGDIEGEFWLGNDNIAEFTINCCHKLRIDIGDFEGNVAYATYSTFSVGSESSLYKLEVDGYSGNASDSLKYQNGMNFSTKDADNDLWYTNCAVDGTGAWWYKDCHFSNLNGKYMTGGVVTSWKGIIWYYWKKNAYSYKFSEMKLR